MLFDEVLDVWREVVNYPPQAHSSLMSFAYTLQSFQAVMEAVPIAAILDIWVVVYFFFPFCFV